MSGEKRKDTLGSHGALIKRARGEDANGQGNDSALIQLSSERSGTSNAIIKRTSGLEAPVMQLTGHEGEIYTCEFDPSGQHIASGGFDRKIMLWNTYGDCQNYGVLKGHVNAVLELHWTRDSNQLVSCSADKTVSLWDASSGERVRRWKTHTGVVNSCQVTRRGTELIVSGSDDGTIQIHDPREKHATQSLESKYQVTSVAISEAGDIVYAGGIDNDINVYDLRKQQSMYSLTGHLDTVSGLALSPDGSHLLSNGMDNAVHMWDVRPFAASNRCVRTFEGAPHGFEKNLIRPAWSTDGSQIVCGSADRSVVIWEVATAKILYKLPGHRGCVNDVDWHPKEPIVMSASTDKTIFLGEVKATRP
ncbi:WD40-repeat-containing domain protein [Gongronella butleri]|nr:WD40-repeat-containing domain protein [Gongronella butleri]